MESASLEGWDRMSLLYNACLKGQPTETCEAAIKPPPPPGPVFGVPQGGAPARRAAFGPGVAAHAPARC